MTNTMTDLLYRILAQTTAEEGAVPEVVEVVSTVAQAPAWSLGNVAGPLGAAAAAIAAAYGISRIGVAALEGSARQPEVADKLKGSMLLAAAFIEGVCLFAVVVGLLSVVL